MKKVLIVYATSSGNTEEVAELIGKHLHQLEGTEVDYYQIGSNQPLPSPSNYDAMFIGSYTWNKGETPHEVKDFAADLGYKPDLVYVFGTGDTQFGGDALFCKAAEKLAKFYNSPVTPLKIEQSPRGSQEKIVLQWVENIMREELLT